MSRLELHREEDPRLSPMTTLSSMNTIYATGSLFSNRPPHGPSSSPRALATFTGTLLVFCVLPHPFLSLFPPFFLQPKSREMLPKHCKLIMALNIYYMMAGGLRGHDASVRERAGERNAGSSSGSSLWSHALSVSQGTTAAHVPQRTCWKTRTNYEDTWLLSHLAYRFDFIALERKLPVLVVFILTSAEGLQSTLIQGQT